MRNGGNPLSCHRTNCFKTFAFMFGPMIHWTGITVNFWIGCTKVSAGSKFFCSSRDVVQHGIDASKLRRRGQERAYTAVGGKIAANKDQKKIADRI